ncbi:unnamed protein product [Cyclocybe aegerita]|uniref:Uncharacterized protein n=1 Tax=Cyclocybe aegerita TaxID=1973307 RepID=A0A8S0WNE3_CYCAE|nr:unnamed protein product [Cyclocybe aegerita]
MDRAGDGARPGRAIRLGVSDGMKCPSLDCLIFSIDSHGRSRLLIIIPSYPSRRPFGSPSPMASRHNQKFAHTQPRTYRLSIKGILSLPFRLCNPPPAVAKVRSCGVTPLFKLRLEDVLDRKHLPPLGLKDFEEWLLFVEMSPENLYFTLWLREYKQRYNQWKAQTAFQSKGIPTGYPLNWSAQYSSQLAMFYARAKQTFFTPASEYELNLSSSLLAPFHKANMPPHPDPALFAEVESETYRMLDESLRRFVTAQFNNVGNKRVLCGIIAGIVFCLLGAVPPLAANFALGANRWARLAALPGLWLGLTILVSSLNGICLGVYIFGDLRQLRKFELARPTISKPQPLPSFRRRGSNAPAPARPLSITNSILPIQHPRKQSLAVTNPGAADFSTHGLHRMPSISSCLTQESAADTQSTASSSSSDDNIQISPAYYDADDVDASEVIYYSDAGHGGDDADSVYRFPLERAQRKASQAEGVESPGRVLGVDVEVHDAALIAPLRIEELEELGYAATATFIHPFAYLDDGEEAEVDADADERLEEAVVVSGARRARRVQARQLQPVFPFDFDALPSRAAFANVNVRAQTHRYHDRRAGLSGPGSATSLALQLALPSPPPTALAPFSSHSPSPFSPAHSLFPSPYSPCSPTSPSRPPRILPPPLTIPSFSSPIPASSSPFPIPFANKRRKPNPPPARAGPTSFLERLQERCNIAMWRFQAGYLEPESPYQGAGAGAGAGMKPHPSSPYWSAHPNASYSNSNASDRFGRHASRDVEKDGGAPSRSTSSTGDSTHSREQRERKAKRRFRMMNAVPAFAVPLTRVLSPVVVRGQWEIVVRSAVLGFLFAWAVVGSLLAVPVPVRR